MRRNPIICWKVNIVVSWIVVKNILEIQQPVDVNPVHNNTVHPVILRAAINVWPVSACLRMVNAK
jgi:hypothetical protein